MKYKKKPRVVEAYQYNGDFEDAPSWVIRAFEDEDIGYIDGGVLVLRHDIGDIVIYEGDYIIIVDDEISTMRKWEFEENYGPASEEV